MLRPHFFFGITVERGNLSLTGRWRLPPAPSRVIFATCNDKRTIFHRDEAVPIQKNGPDQDPARWKSFRPMHKGNAGRTR
jgi:hypothetical protein